MKVFNEPTSSKPSLMRRLGPWFVVPAGVLVLLFEPLFTDSSLLGFDNRLMQPFVVHLTGHEPPRGMNLVTSDINGWIMPETMVELDRLRRGEIPLWNPYMNCGQPLLANLAFAPFYPTTLLYILASSPIRAYAWSMAFHLILLGWGMQLLLRRFDRSTGAALFGALVLTFCGFAGVHVHLPHFVRTAAWFPLILVAIDRLVLSPSRRSTGLLALGAGLSLLAGFPQLAFINLFAALGFFLVRLGDSPARSASLGGGMGALVVAGLLGAIHLLPAVELRAQSWRSHDLDAAAAAAKRLEPELLLGLVLPHLFGDVSWPVDVNAPEARRHQSFPTYRAWLDDDVQNNFVENTLYVGLLPLIFVIMACMGRPRRGDLCFALMGAIGLAVALGVPGIADLARALPGVGAGSPKRLLFLQAFAMAWLAASGIDRLRSAEGRRVARWLLAPAVCFLALGALLQAPFERWLVADASEVDRILLRETVTPDLIRLGLAGLVLLSVGLLVARRRPSVAVAVVIGVTLFDLIGFTRAVNPVQPLHGQYAATPATDWLAERCGLEGARCARIASPFCLPAELAQLFGIRSVNGTAALVLRRTGELWRSIDPGVLDVADPRVVGVFADSSVLASPLLDLAAVRYVIIDRLPKALPANCHLVYQSPREGLAILARDSALGPAFFVEGLRVEADAGKRLLLLASEDFAPEREAILEGQPDGLKLEGWSRASLRFRRPSPEEIRIDTEGDRAFLVVTESWLPQWAAEVDGRQVPLHRVDHAFMGVALEAGRHSVRLLYRPVGFLAGAACFLLALIGLAVMLRPQPRRVRGPGSVETDRRAESTR